MQVSKRLTPSNVEQRAASMLRLTALSLLSQTQPIPLTELASRMESSVSSTAQLVDRLLRDGFVMRSENKSDRRRVDLFLTEAGSTERTYLQQQMLDKLEKIFAPLNQADRHELTRILTTLTLRHTP